APARGHGRLLPVQLVPEPSLQSIRSPFLPSEGSHSKIKSGRETHRTRPCAFEQAVNYTERATFKQMRLGRCQPRLYDLADDASIGVFTGQSSLDGLHDFAHVLNGTRACFGDHGRDDLFDL